MTSMINTMARTSLVAVALILSTPASAQQQPPDPAALQKAVQALQQQRNAAMDQAAGLQVQAATLAEENDRLKKQVEELQKAAPAKP